MNSKDNIATFKYWFHKYLIPSLKTGLLPWFEGRIYSGHETPRNKPHPDVYLAAMQGLQVPPAQCLVLEDTLTGIRAAAAAGATTIAYRTPNNPLLTP